MAETQELTVALKTVYDGSGAKQAQQSLQELARSQKIAAADRAADLTQAQIRQAGGFEAFLAQQRAGTGQAAALSAQNVRAVGQSAALSAQNMRQLAQAFVGYSSAVAIAHAVLSQIAQSMGDAVQATREYQRAVPGLTTSTTDLDKAFLAAQKSGDTLQITLGKIAAPVVVAGLKEVAKAADELNDALKRLPDLGKWIEEHNKPPFAEGTPRPPWLERALRGEAPFAPAAEATATQATQATQSLFDLEEQYQRTAKRLRELNASDISAGITTPANTAAQLARLAYWDQVDAAVRDIRNAQHDQLDLQRESVGLAAKEAQLRLGMLPTQERLAALQRQVTEQQIRARLAALPATEALEDAQYALQRAQLILGDRRGTTPEERAAARREIRDLTRNVLPGAERAALDANRGVQLAGRAAERVGLEQQLFQVTQEGILAQVTLAEQTNALLSTIAEQRTQAIQLTISLSAEGLQQDIYNQLIEANKQVIVLPTIPQSGVRRN